jgi:hypothetical protein
MEQNLVLTRPRAFVYGNEYLLIEQPVKNVQKQVSVPVRFAAYDPCPAFVIVRTERGLKRRCPRDELFTGPGQD